MKKILLSFLFLLCHVVVSSQVWFDYTINFDDSLWHNQIIFDTTGSQSNIWQVGTPKKNELNLALSIPDVIITDTINPYPINCSSSFVVQHMADGGFTLPHTAILAGYYWVNSDYKHDTGTIEFSPDNGLTWIDLINDTVYSDYYYWWTNKPILSGNSGGWVEFSVFLAPLGPAFGIQEGDTVLYRFSFHSDNNPESLDGLMFDDLHFEDWYEGLAKHEPIAYLASFPNPVANLLNIVVPEFDYSEILSRAFIEIYSVIGQKLLQVPVENGQKKVEVDVSSLPKGMVIVHLVMDGHTYSTTKVMIR